MRDAKLEEMEVYCYDRASHLDVGFSFTKSGEEFVIDKESSFKVAWQPVRIEDGQSTNFEIAKDIEEAINYAVDKSNEILEQSKTEYEAKLESQKTEYETQINGINSELEELKQYKANIELATKTDYVNNVENLEKFEKDELISKITEFSIEEIADEVAKIVGKKMIKFSAGDVVKDTFVPHYEKEEVKKAYDHLFTEKE
jgi:hypothetical protein